MGLTMKLSKLILFVFNAVFFLLGAGALTLGVFLVVDKDYLLNIIGKIPSSEHYDVDAILNTTSYLKNGAAMLICAGTFIFFIAFCGLCGGMKENKYLLYIYAGLIGVILAIQLAAGVMCKLYGGMVESYLLNWLRTLLNDYYIGASLDGSGSIVQAADTTGISDAIDFAQIYLGCCGVASYFDYANTSQWSNSYSFTSGGVSHNISDALVPVSCCKMINPDAWPMDIASIEFVSLPNCLSSASYATTNLDSCYSVVLALLDEYTTYAIGLGLGVALIESFGIIAAMCVIRQTKER